MADLIEKIGRFFAQQESQIQETYTQVTKAAPRAQPRPPPPAHKIPVPLTAQSPVFERRSPVASAVPKLPRNNSLAHRRLAVKSAVESTVSLQSSECPVESINQILDGVQLQSKVRDIPPLSLSAPRPPLSNLLPREDIWSHNLSGGVVSWKSSSSPVSTSSSRGSSFKDDDRSSQPGSDVNKRPRKPRPPQQKNRKRLCKKTSKRSGNQKDDQPDPRAVAKANTEKVAAALALAQERAARFQQDKLQLDRERELERQEAALRLQEQMMRIEAVRASSFRHSSSTVTTSRSSLSYCNSEGNNHETESVWTADSNDMLESHKSPSEFMTGLEAQIREKMSLEMHVKQSYIEKHKQRERVRLRLDKVLQQNAVQSSKIARLSAMKASLEMELAAVLEDTAQNRQQRRELELAGEKERLRRQREAERALQIRLREEEWASMVEKERERSQVAAEARAKASKRVEAHSAQLRKMLQAYRYEPRHSVRSESSSSTHSNNNDGDHGDPDSYVSDKDFSSKPAHPFKMDFFPPPELADFEEDGLCDNKDDLPIAIRPNNNESSEAASPPHSKLPKLLPFQWQVPKITDEIKFTQVLLDMVSDDEDD